MECVQNCEFMRFGNGSFFCGFYEEDLHSEKSLSVEKPESVLIFRCEKCVKDGEIGTGTKEEFVRKIKKHVGDIMDSFYSYKDDIESEVSDLYRLVKKFEEGE
jgi:hypothetical protein